MKKIQIIRIEHFDGYGLFRTQDGFNYYRDHNVVNILPELSKRHYNFNSPSEDKLEIFKDNKEWFCAYKSIDQLQQWILKSEFQTLFDNDYMVLLIECTMYQIGRDQIIYTKESIKSCKDISELFQ